MLGHAVHSDDCDCAHVRDNTANPLLDIFDMLRVLSVDFVQRAPSNLDEFLLVGLRLTEFAVTYHGRLVEVAGGRVVANRLRLVVLDEGLDLVARPRAV